MIRYTDIRAATPHGVDKLKYLQAVADQIVEYSKEPQMVEIQDALDRKDPVEISYTIGKKVFGFILNKGSEVLTSTAIGWLIHAA